LGNLATPKRVQKLQAALHAKAKAEAGYRFYALYDKISRDDILAHAYVKERRRGRSFRVHRQHVTASRTRGRGAPRSTRDWHRQRPGRSPGAHRQRPIAHAPLNREVPRSIKGRSRRACPAFPPRSCEHLGSGSQDQRHSFGVRGVARTDLLRRRSHQGVFTCEPSRHRAKLPRAGHRCKLTS
jgi:hypothetical protein